MTKSLLERSAVIPVVVIDDVNDALPLTSALFRGGVDIVEITLRTAVALDAISVIARELPEVLVGAGTVTDARLAAAAVAAGARFLVSPGATPPLLDAMVATGVAVLPGVQTASEILAAHERGLNELKFFPAGAAGGPEYLRSISGPFPGVRFCATGGVTADSAPAYLQLPNVRCVGGSWLTPAGAVAAGDWLTVERLAREAAAMGVLS